MQGATPLPLRWARKSDVTVEYVYGNQFFGDADITAYMDNWYQTMGVQAVFACGGGIYTSAAEAAAKVNAKVIGVDVDQAGIINAYGEGMTVTSAMKGLAATVNTLLTEIKAGNFANYGGKVETLGLVSGTDMDANYVGISCLHPVRRRLHRRGLRCAGCQDVRWRSHRVQRHRDCSLRLP